MAIWISCNTVNLSGKNSDAVFGLRGWLGPVVVVGALDSPVCHLAFDDAWVGAEASLGEGSARISAIACSCAASILWGGKSRLGAGGAAGGA